MAVPFDVPHGTKVRVWYEGFWYEGEVIENAKDNDRMIVVRTFELAHKDPFLNGHGFSVGHKSDEIELISDGTL